MPAVQTVTRIIQAHIVRSVEFSTHSQWEHLLIRRAITQTHFPDMWQVVTGTIEEDETPLQTAFREIEEETGLIARELFVLPHIGIFYDASKNAMNLVPCFAAILSPFSQDNQDNQDNIVRLSNEHSEFKWCLPEEATRTLVIPSHIQGVEVLEQHILPLLSRGEMPVFARHLRS